MKFRWFTLLAVFLSLAVPAFAQDRAVVAEVTKALGAAEASLTTIEKQVTEMERAKALANPEAFEALLKSYRGELGVAFSTTLGVAEREAKSSDAGAKAAAARIAAWEQLIPTHRERMEKVLGRLNLLDGTIKTANLDSDFGDRLADLFQPAPACVSCQRTRLLPNESAGVGDFLSDLVEPEADAAIAATCVLTCTASPAVCGACIIAAVGTGAFVATLLDDAFAGCARRPTRVGRAVCNAATVLAFITVIA